MSDGVYSRTDMLEVSIREDGSSDLSCEER
jgi:hypothetical protein